MASGLSRIISNTQRQIGEKKGVVDHNLSELRDQDSVAAGSATQGLQPTEALKTFFDRIPVSSIPGLRNAGVVELTSSESIANAIHLLYSEKLMGAPVRDESIRESQSSICCHIGLVDLGSMVLWAFQEFEQAEVDAKNKGLVLPRTQGNSSVGAGKEARGEGRESLPITADSGFLLVEVERLGFFETVRQHPSVRDTKVASMARCFRLDPFLPVQAEDTLLNILLRLSKHTLNAIPLVDNDQDKITGFITQEVAVRLLLQCAGLEWFDTIAEKQLCSIGFEVNQLAGNVVSVNNDFSVIRALLVMWKHRLGAVPVIDHESKKLVGHIRTADLRLLLENADVFEKRRVMKVEEFMNLEAGRKASREEKKDVQDVGSGILAGSLRWGYGWSGRMREPVTSKTEETLKECMEKMVKGRSDRCFVVDEQMQLLGVMSLQNIILQFAPPLSQAAFPTAGFF